MNTCFFKRLLFLLCLVLISTIGLTSCKENKSTSTSSSNPSVSEQEYTSKMTKSDKKKYYNANDEVVYEVKYKPKGFKLRSASSELLWKIKLYESKVKISDNEENTNPWEIKMVSSKEAKLVKNETEIARTHYDAETFTQSINFEDTSNDTTKKDSYSPSFLVETINDIPKDQQKIIMAELKDKGY